MIDVYKTLTRAHLTQNISPNDRIIVDITENISKDNYDFSTNGFYKHNGRLVTYYKQYTPEHVIVLHCKNLLSKKLQVSFSNRNQIIDEIFDKLQAISTLNDFTLIKFDFKSFFYTISSQYVFDKYLENADLDRPDKKFLGEFCGKNKYCVAGIPLINYLVEIVSRDLDEKLKAEFSSKGIVLYSRYVDDGMLMLNQFIDYKEARKIINTCIEKVFFDKTYTSSSMNKVRLNNTKYKVINRRFLTRDQSFNFLGYDFKIKADFKGMEIGVTDTKIEKYQRRVNKLVKTHYDPADPAKVELTRHIIKAHGSRVIYCSRTKKSKDMWISKGFVSNYNRLQDYNKFLDTKTRRFLNKIYYNAFLEAGHTPPPFLRQTRYSLSDNIKVNRAMIFDELIGISKKQLLKELTKIGNTKRTEKDDYHSIAREYLIAVRVGY